MFCPKRSLLLRPRTRQRAFSLAELVIVIVIIGIIAAIAVPRVSQANRNSQANAIRATLTNVRVAIDHYYAEHSRYPGYNPADSAPDGTWFVDQLTKYSDSKGSVSSGYTQQYCYGAYLRPPFPTNPFNNLNSVAVKQKTSGVVALGSSGWIACLEDGSFDINASTTELESLDFSATEKISSEKAIGL